MDGERNRKCPDISKFTRRESEREKFSSRAVRMNGVLKKKTGVIRYLMQIALCDSPMYEENISKIVVTGAV